MPQRLGMAPCVFCRRPFGFDPSKVPTVPPPAGSAAGSAAGGARKRPVCPDCLGPANAARRSKGLPAVAVAPGAYYGR